MGEGNAFGRHIRYADGQGMESAGRARKDELKSKVWPDTSLSRYYIITMLSQGNPQPAGSEVRSVSGFPAARRA